MNAHETLSQDHFWTYTESVSSLSHKLQGQWRRDMLKCQKHIRFIDNFMGLTLANNFFLLLFIKFKMFQPFNMLLFYYKFNTFLLYTYYVYFTYTYINYLFQIVYL